MAQPKKRIYELARELNLTNKTLLEKIGPLELGLSSHMSTLDDDIEARIRHFIQGGPEPDLEEKRVRPTVIRRRRKAATPEEIEAQEAEAREAEAQEAATQEIETQEIETEAVPLNRDSEVEVEAQTESAVEVETEPEMEDADDRQAKEEPAVEIDVQTEAHAEIEAEAEPQEDIEKAVIITKAKANEPAEPVAAPVETHERAQEPEPVEVDAQSQQVSVEQAGEKAPIETEEAAQETETQQAMESADDQAEARKVSEPADTQEADMQEKEGAKGKLAPKAKKKKKDTPAKIIRLPERQAAPKPRPAAPKVEAKEEIVTRRPRPAKPVAQEPPPPAVPAKEDRPKKKGKKKVEREEEPVQDKRLLKKKVAFRKKEVVEGSELYSDRSRGRKGRKGGKAKAVPAAQKTQITTAKAIKRRVRIDETIMLSDLAKRMGIKASDMIAKLFGMGIVVTVNQTIDFDTAALVAAEFNYEVERATFEEDTILKSTEQEDPDKLAHRPPVVTIMGHVDHGKTSLLDVIRKSRVTEGEAGGITQHIGAYLVSTEKGQIAFLDTPGHEAFSAMRSRGAQVTDIVILVVAADDGVMPQTIEAINHSKAAKVPILVAVNKIDKPNAEPDRVRRQLAEVGVVPEDWGGDSIFVNVSAKQESGIDDLMDMILLQAEMLELKANPDKLALGHVVEAKLDSGRGPVATVLVKEGTLKTGDAIVCGVHHGKVRALLDDRGNKVDLAGPSMPVEIIGLSGVPMAGDEMVALKDDKDAKNVSQHRIQKQRSKELAKTSRLSLDKLYERMREGEVKDLNLIIKADVDGSLEAIRDSLTKLSNEEVTINVMHAATGTITESDISLAAVSEAIIIGFNVRPNPKVQEMANEENVDIRYHNIIYNVIKEIKDAIVGMMESTFEERVLGRAEVRQVFHVPKVGTVAGCYVTDGKIERGQLSRLLRDGIVIYDGKNISLRRFKEDVKEAQTGYECGIGLENYNDVKVGDVIECYYLEEIRPEVS